MVKHQSWPEQGGRAQALARLWDPGARCKQVQTAEECFTRSGRIVRGQSPPCLPRSAASAGYFPEWLWALRAQTRWSDRPRPSLPQIPAQGWHGTRRPAALMYGGVPPPAGRGQRTGGLQQLGPALQQQVATIVRQLRVLQQIPALYWLQVSTTGEHTRACVVIQGKCAHVEFEQEAGDHVQQSRNARRGLLLCCRPGLLACDTLALHSCYCSTKGWGLSGTMLGSVENVCIYQNKFMS